MKNYKMNDGNKFYDYPGQREELINKEKHIQTCLKNKKKRKKNVSNFIIYIACY